MTLILVVFAMSFRHFCIKSTVLCLVIWGFVSKGIWNLNLKHLSVIIVYKKKNTKQSFGFHALIFFSPREKAIQRILHQWRPGHGPPGLREQPRAVSPLHQQFGNRSRRPPAQPLHRDDLDGRGRPSARGEMRQRSGEPQQLPHLRVQRGRKGSSRGGGVGGERWEDWNCNNSCATCYQQRGTAAFHKSFVITFF